MNRADVSLNAIVDPARARGRDLADLAAAAARGGATLIQYRDKNSPVPEMLARALGIKAALDGTGVPLLVNDRVDVALAAGADGVHVGQEDMTPEDARALLGPDAIVGLTIKTEAQAEAAPVDIIDYVGVGGVFETMSKVNPDRPIGLEGLSRIAAIFRRRRPDLPIVAIAGMTGERAGPVIGAGADGLAVVSAIFMEDDPEAAARELRSSANAALKARGG